jgi:hypothetical protein
MGLFVSGGTEINCHAGLVVNLASVLVADEVGMKNACAWLKRMTTEEIRL